MLIIHPGNKVAVRSLEFRERIVADVANLSNLFVWNVVSLGTWDLESEISRLLNRMGHGLYCSGL